MVILSFLIGLGVFYILNPDLRLAFISGVLSTVFHLITKPNWRSAIKLLTSLFLSYPKALLESFMIFFRHGETFEIEEINEDEIVEKTLSVTLTPLSVVFLSERDRIHIHRVVRKS